jgi:hypothetical protein
MGIFIEILTTGLGWVMILSIIVVVAAVSTLLLFYVRTYSTKLRSYFDVLKQLKAEHVKLIGLADVTKVQVSDRKKIKEMMARYISFRLDEMSNGVAEDAPDIKDVIEECRKVLLDDAGIEAAVKSVELETAKATKDEVRKALTTADYSAIAPATASPDDHKISPETARRWLGRLAIAFSVLGMLWIIWATNRLVESSMRIEARTAIKAARLYVTSLQDADAATKSAAQKKELIRKLASLKGEAAPTGMEMEALRNDLLRDQVKIKNATDNARGSANLINLLYEKSSIIGPAASGNFSESTKDFWLKQVHALDEQLIKQQNEPVPAGK